MKIKVTLIFLTFSFLGSYIFYAKEQIDYESLIFYRLAVSKLLFLKVPSRIRNHYYFESDLIFGADGEKQ